MGAANVAQFEVDGHEWVKPSERRRTITHATYALSVPLMSLLKLDCGLMRFLKSDDLVCQSAQLQYQGDIVGRREIGDQEA